jgi:hypothetical protein
MLTSTLPGAFLVVTEALTMSLEELRQQLNGLGTGPVTDPSMIESLLCACWDELDGDVGGMTSDKLFGRTETLIWTPPHLTFMIERHGGTVMGSSRAALQHWTIDVTDGSRACSRASHRQLKPMSPRLDVTPLAEELATRILRGIADHRLKWIPPDRVRVLISTTIPGAGAAKQTIDGRRKRFWKELDNRLEAGWVRKRDTYSHRSE